MKASLTFLSLFGFFAVSSSSFTHDGRSSNVTLDEVLEALETATTCDDCQVRASVYSSGTTQETHANTIIVHAQTDPGSGE
jgi:hypothetical protein